MEFGLSFLPDVDDTLMSASTYFDMAIRLAEFADRQGLSHIKMTEHYLQSYGGYCPSPLGFLSAVAARTSNIRLMTGCLLPVFHHPIQIASEVAMLDAISCGRVDLGVARAYMPYEFEAFGIPIEQSRARFDETIDAVLRCWTDTAVTVDGPFFRFREATTLPRPTQFPHPPVWVAAVRSERSFVEAGERGFGLLVTPSLTPLDQVASWIALYKQSFRAAQPGAKARVFASLPMYVGSSSREATRTGDSLLERYLTSWARSASAWDGRAVAGYDGYSDMGSLIRQVTPEYLRTVGGAVIGDSAQVTERIHDIQSQLNVDGYLWQVDFGGPGFEQALASTSRFVSKVKPAFCDVSAAA